MQDHEIVLDHVEVADLRRGEALVGPVPGGQVQLCGPGSVVMEFVDATNIYLSTRDLDLIESDSAGHTVKIDDVDLRIRMEGAPR